MFNIFHKGVKLRMLAYFKAYDAYFPSGSVEILKYEIFFSSFLRLLWRKNWRLLLNRCFISTAVSIFLEDL